MIAELQREADRVARQAMRDMIAYIALHGGRRSAALDDTYRAAERVVDAIEELERNMAIGIQAEDAGAPDYHQLYAEGDQRADWGNR